MSACENHFSTVPSTRPLITGQEALRRTGRPDETEKDEKDIGAEKLPEVEDDAGATAASC